VKKPECPRAVHGDEWSWVSGGIAPNHGGFFFGRSPALWAVVFTFFSQSAFGNRAFLIYNVSPEFNRGEEKKLKMEL
jgi:hypothetical protein